jgi:hypothetical protein
VDPCTSSCTKSVSSASASPIGRIRQSFSFPASTKRPSAATSAVLHRLEQEHVRTALRLGPGRDEEVCAVEVDRVDLLEPDEAVMSIERLVSRFSIASRSASSTITN